MWSLKRVLGNKGEDFACRFLMKHGFRILERNYLKKCGEIDIVAQKGNNLHFVEVKTVTHETNREAGTFDSYRAEDNVHKYKLMRLAKTIEIYLEDKKIDDTIDWQIDLITVILDKKGKCIDIQWLDNIIM